MSERMYDENHGGTYISHSELLGLLNLKFSVELSKTQVLDPELVHAAVYKEVSRLLSHLYDTFRPTPSVAHGDQPSTVPSSST
jgi:hypothetical protein